MSDPITQLLADLDDAGRPTPEWLAVWAADGTLARAWRASRDAPAMLDLLARAWGDHAAEAAADAAARRAALLGGPADADTVREVVAVPPTLAELMGDP